MTTQNTLRNELYNQIEVLESKLQNVDFNQFGFGESDIHAQIDELETKLAATWTN